MRDEEEDFLSLFFSWDRFLAAALKSLLLLNVGLEDTTISGGEARSGDDEVLEADEGIDNDPVDDEWDLAGAITADHNWIVHQQSVRLVTNLKLLNVKFSIGSSMQLF